MLIRIPHDRNMDYDEYIDWFLTWFQDLYKKPYIQSAYKGGVANITQDTAFIDEVSEGGNYWNDLVEATYKVFIPTYYESLSEFLMDYSIEEIVPTIFEVGKDPNSWPDDVKAYAYGN